jgi:uncharacterized membrane protein
MEESINLKQIKILGGVGSILSLLGGLPQVGSLLALSGFIMVLIAIFNLEKSLKEKGIFSKFLIGSLLSWFVSFVISLSLIAFILLAPAAISLWTKAKPFLLLIILFFLFCWVLIIFGSYLIKKSYEKIAMLTKERKFAQAGFFNFIGAITLIVLVGFILSCVGQIFAILAFFSLPDELKREIEKEKVA